MENRVCSFCGKQKDKEDLIIHGLEGNICENCAKLLQSIIEDNKTIQNINNELKLPTPKEIKSFLDDYIISQDSAKIKIAVAVYNHYKRIYCNDNNNNEIDKSNIILLGPTGTGKTLIARSIAKMLNIPFVIADSTSLTQSGYVGEDVESVLSKLYQAANYDIDKTEKGIVFLDEIDKIALKSGSTSITRDVSGEGVQQSLLKMLEGSIVNVPPNGGRIHPEQKLIPINTKNILFICGGAFIGIEQNIKSRLNKKTVGFNIETKSSEENIDILDYIIPDDLRHFGLIPELIGRLPIIAHTQKLTKDTLTKILVEPKNSLISQYKTLLNLDGKTLHFTKGAIEYIAELADSTNIGARGLRGIMERLMETIMFESPSNDEIKITIDKKYTKNKLDKYYKNGRK